LTWDLQVGPAEGKLQKHLLRRHAAGLDTPTLDEEPPLHYDDLFHWRAFWVLSKARTWGFQGTPFPIPISEILAFAVYHSIEDREGRDELLYLLRAMDDAWLREKVSGRTQGSH
jgi:hypothetical protein